MRARFLAIASSTAFSSLKSSSRREVLDAWLADFASDVSIGSRGVCLIGMFSGSVRLVFAAALSADLFRGLDSVLLSSAFFDEDSSIFRLLDWVSTCLGVSTLSAARLIGLLDAWEDVTSSLGLECR